MNLYVLPNLNPNETKWEKFKRKSMEKFNEAKEWCIENKETILLIVPIAVGTLTTMIKVVGKNANLNKEENLKNLYCYDRSLGHYWKLRRELSNDEWLEIDRRKKNGERLSDILDELRVLK